MKLSYISSQWQLIWHKQLRRPYRLHIIDHGTNGPTVILLHGIAASSANWSHMLEELQPKYHCITIDLLGFGDSPKPQWGDYTLDDHMRAIRYTIRKLHLRSEYILVGHSLGSLLATHYARLWSHRIQRLLLLSPPIYSPLDAIGSTVARKRTALFLKLYKFVRTHPRMTPQNFKRLGRLLPLPTSIVVHPETWIPFMRTLEHCIEQQVIHDDLAQLHVPTTIFYGLLDQLLVIANITLLAKTAGIASISIRGANHDVGRRYAKTVAKHLTTI